MPTKSRKGKRAGAIKPVRYAVIGLGHIAQAAVLPAFAHARSNSVLAALVSGTPKKLRSLGRRYGVERQCSYENVDALFESGDIDAVYIALPNHLHREMTERAARAKLHVLCEKPMAVNAKDCVAMRRAARQNGVKLMIAYRLHLERASLEVARIARSRQLGAMRFFTSDFSMQIRSPNIRLLRKEGGGPLHDIGIYCINAARSCFAADPLEVFAAATRGSDARFKQAYETVVAVMRFSRDRLASFTCSFGAADRSTYTLTGTRGSITVDPAYEYASAINYVVRKGGREKHRGAAKRDQFAAELAYFSSCIRGNRDPEPSADEGLMDVHIIEAMMRSISSRRWVRIDAKPLVRRATLRQEIHRPAVPAEPKLVGVAAAGR